MLTYWYVLHPAVPSDMPRDMFYSKLAQIFADQRTTVVGFDEALSREIKMKYPAMNLIASYHDVVSPADGHPNVEGARQIADEILPIVRSAVERACTAMI